MDIKFKLRSIWNEIKRLPYNIRNILSWIPVLWNNFDWDSEYLLEIMRFKLAKMEQYFIESGVTEDHNEIAERIGGAIYYIDMLCNGTYENQAYEKYYEKYPSKILDLEEKIINGIKYTTIRPMGEEQKKLFLECMEEADRLNKLYKNGLFKTLSEFQNWWD